MLLRELLLLLHLVGTDPHPLGADRLELGLHVTEVTALLGAAVGHRRRIEEQDHGARAGQVAQLPRCAILVGKFEVGYRVAFLHVAEATGHRSSMHWADR